MGINGIGSRPDIAPGVPLPEAFRLLNEQRVEIDGRLAEIPADNPARELLWLELEPILAKIREVVGDLAKSPVSGLADLQAKAAVLASLIRPEQENGGPIVPEMEKFALTLSLTDDIARLAGNHWSWHSLDHDVADKEFAQRVNDLIINGVNYVAAWTPLNKNPTLRHLLEMKR